MCGGASWLCLYLCLDLEASVYVVSSSSHQGLIVGGREGG
jgi:hypothetical protein